jgi:hypothetical protein
MAMNITNRLSGFSPASGFTALSGLVSGQHMLRYAVGASFVFIAAASVVALDDKQAWFHHASAQVNVSQEAATPPMLSSREDSQPEIVFDHVRIEKPTQFAAAEAPVTDATPAPVVPEAPVMAKLIEPPVPPVQEKVVAPPAPPAVKKAVIKDLPPLTPKQSAAPVSDNLFAARQLLNSGDLDHAKALLVFLQDRLGRETGGHEDVAIAKTILADAVAALDDGNTDRAMHKVNVATTCYTVHCPPPNAR